MLVTWSPPHSSVPTMRWRPGMRSRRCLCRRRELCPAHGFCRWLLPRAREAATRPTSGRAARQLRAAPASQARPACPSHMRELPRITGAAREWGDGRARGSEFPNTSPATTRFGWRADSGRELRSVGHEGQVQVPARGGSCSGAEAPEERGTCRQGERPRGNQLKRCHARGASGIADSTPRRHALTGTDRCWPPCRSSGQPARPPCPRSAYG